MDLITSLTSQVMNKAMDGLSKRHTSIASNLANVDTPGYRRQDVQFEDALGQALKREKGKMAGMQDQRKTASNDVELEMSGSKPGHFNYSNSSSNSLSDFRATIEEADDNLSFRNDGNTVDLESEMAQLAKNTQKYNAIANIQGRRGKTIKNILNSG